MLVGCGEVCCLWRYARVRVAMTCSVCLLVVFFLFALTQPLRAETLFDALRAAYKNNPSLLAERARQRADDEAVPQALSGFRPTVSLTGSVGQAKQRRARPITHDELDQRNVGITISQPLFQGFRAINSTRRARAQVYAGQESLFDKEQSVLLDVVTAFVDVRRARRVVRLRQDNVRFLKREAKVAQARAREGELSRTDTEQAKSRFYRGEATLAEARAVLAESEANYEALVGYRPGRLQPLPPVRLLLPRSLSNAINVGEENNPLVRAALYRKEAAEHEMQAQRGELLPTVSLDGTYEREFQSTATIDRQDEASLKLNFSMPLYNAGSTFSKIRQARAVVTQRKYEVADTRRQVKALVISSWRRRIEARRRMRATHVGVTSAEATLKGIQLQAAVGERSVFDLLDAQRDVVDARVLQVNAERDFIVSTYTLMAALGQLSVEKLELGVALYDPNKNYRKVRYAPGWIPTITRN